jgi:hypothetical protein
MQYNTVCNQLVFAAGRVGTDPPPYVDFHPDMLFHMGVRTAFKHDAFQHGGCIFDPEKAMPPRGFGKTAQFAPHSNIA